MAADAPGPKSQEMAPSNFHSMNIKVYAELASGLNAMAHIDFTCCDVVFANASVVKDIPYFGVCFSKEHQDSES